MSAVAGPPEARLTHERRARRPASREALVLTADYQLLLDGQPPLVLPCAVQARVTVPSVALAIVNVLPVFEVTVSV